MTGFHEVLFPLDISLHGRGGPERRTEIVALGSGREERNARWAHSRRRYDAGYGVKIAGAARRGGRFLRGAARPALRLSLARPADHSSAAPGAALRRSDQAIGVGDGTTAQLPARRRPMAARFAPYSRASSSRSPASVRVAVAGVEATKRRAFRLRCDDRRRDASLPRAARGGAAVTRRLSVRRAGALRHRLSRGRHLGLRGRRDSENSADRDHALDEEHAHARCFHRRCRQSSTARATTLCHCWRLARTRRRVMGFTDHDRDLAFGDVVYRADTGLSATQSEGEPRPRRRRRRGLGRARRTRASAKAICRRTL